MNIKRINLYLTSKCNLKCKHCCMGERLVTWKTMDKVRAIQIVDYFSSLPSLSLITLMGGEPTIVPYFIDLIAYINLHFKGKVSVITNGIKQGAFDSLEPSQLDCISVSIDGATSKTHDAIRGSLTFDRALKTIQKLVDREFKTSIIFTVNSINISEVLQAIFLFESMGVGEINFHVMSLNGNALKDMSLSVQASQWLKVVESIEKIKDNRTIKIRYPLRYVSEEGYKKEKEQGYHCILKDVERLHIFPDGRVYSCCLFLDTSLHSYEFSDHLVERKITERKLYIENPSTLSSPRRVP